MMRMRSPRRSVAATGVRGGTEIVDLQECPVTASAIVRLLPGLRRLVEPLMSRRAPGRVVVTLAANGVDVAVEDVPGDPSPDVREFLAREAATLQLARLTLAGDTLYQATVPEVRFGTANVVLPARSQQQLEQPRGVPEPVLQPGRSGRSKPAAAGCPSAARTAAPLRSDRPRR